MYNNILLSRYYPVKSKMHNMNPFLKMLCTIIFIIILLITNNLSVITILFLVNLIMMLRSNVPLKLYFKTILSIIVLIAIYLIIALLVTTNYEFILIVLLKVIMIILYTSVLTFTSTPTEITYGFQKILSPLKLLCLPTSKIALELTMGIRYIPILMEQAEKLTKTAASRGIDYTNSNFFGKIKAMIVLAEPLFRLANKRSKELLLSMEIRMYTVYNKRTSYRNKRIGFKDIFIVFLHLLILGVFIYKEVFGIGSLLDNFFI